MAVIICIAGAVLGVAIAIVSGRLALPMVLRAQEAQLRDGRMGGLPAPLRDPQRLRSFTIAVYHYVMPLVFGVVGATAAYYLFIGDAP